MKDKIKFGVITGNPPYQKTIDNTSDKPIYDYFMDISYDLSGLVCLITPARFLFNAGKTNKKWNEKILSDEYIEVSKYFKNSTYIFNNIDIKGGIAITKRNMSKKCTSIGSFIPDKELECILKKVISRDDYSSVIEQIYLQNKFNLESLYLDYPNAKNIIGNNGKEKRLTTAIFKQLHIFKDEKINDNYVKILGLVNNNRVFKWVDKKYLDNQENFKKYKIILPKSNGFGAIGEIENTPLIGKPVIGNELEGYTQSFIGIFSLNNKEEAISALKYIKSKFARALLGTLKVTQDNNRETWQNVPMQDFSENSDIDWSKSIKEIDLQLYKKYNLNENEINFIESKIQSME